MSLSKTKGFTLIEMLIVVVIIGILAAALIPRLKSAEARARDVAKIATLKDIYSAIELYKNDYGKYYDGGNYQFIPYPYALLIKI